MAYKDDIKQALRELVRPQESSYSVLCTVNEIDTDNLVCDCSPLNGDADLLDVKLMAEKNTGFLIIPKTGSTVVVSMLSNQTGYVSMFSEIDSIQLNGDNYDGLVRIQDLVTKLNNLENQVNDILNVLKTTTIPLAPSGTYPFAPLYSSINDLTTTQQSDIENTTVKHGNGNE